MNRSKNYVFVIKGSRNEPSFKRLRNNVVVVIKPLRIETITKRDSNNSQRNPEFLAMCSLKNSSTTHLQHDSLVESYY